MSNFIIDSRTLPNIGDPTKRMINQGVWYLYKVDYPPKENVKFALIADKDIYFLDNQGISIFSETTRPNEAKFNQTVYFNDLPAPDMISNYKLS